MYVSLLLLLDLRHALQQHATRVGLSEEKKKRCANSNLHARIFCSLYPATDEVQTASITQYLDSLVEIWDLSDFVL